MDDPDLNAPTDTAGTDPAAGVDPAPVDGDEYMVSWWQRPLNLTIMIILAAVAAGPVGWWIGERAATVEPNTVDIGFLQDMRTHHEQAVEMSETFLELDGTSPGLRIDAQGILVGQSIEIGRMAQLLNSFNAPETRPGNIVMGWMGMPLPVEQMPGMATADELAELAASSGPEADKLFAELMIPHHQGGIHMAEVAATDAAVEEVRLFAAAIRDNQLTEIAELQKFVE